MTKAARPLLLLALAARPAQCLRIQPALPTRGGAPRMSLPTTQSEWHRAKTEGVPEALPSTDEEWRRVLEPMQYAVLREEATEPKWSSELNDVKEPGVFLCAGCAQPLFTTAAKFESGSGWPSFWAPAAPSSVITRVDFKALLPRTEVVCEVCGGHLGHVFDDGPPPTGQRFCMNGAALEFEAGTARSEAAVAAFAESADSIRGPPLAKVLAEAALSGMACAGLLYSWWVTEQAGAGAPWAIEALRGSGAWLGGAVNTVFGRPPGGPLTLLLAGLNGLTVLQKLPLIAHATRARAPSEPPGE